MSTKALRLLQKEREKLYPDNTSHESDEEIEVHPTKMGNAFDLLREDSDVDNQNDQEIDEDQSQVNSTKQKKNKKKRKNKAKTAKKENNVDDLDTILNDLLLHPQSEKVIVEVSTSFNKGILHIEHKYLDHENELRKMFGAHIVESNKRNHKLRNAKKYRLVNPRPNWRGLERSGISMELVRREGSEMYFDIEHSRAYREVQLLFLDAVESADPNSVMNIVRQYPFHIDSLLQLCEICKLSEDWETATEIIERAVHIFERGFHPLFSLTQGTCRLDYTRKENRGFLLSLFQYMTFLGKKGCNRTSLEYCKLILSLSPDSDPLAMLLMLDTYALKSEEFDFLVRFYTEWRDHKNLFQLPNFAFSYPLALFNLASQTKDEGMLHLSDERLRDALLMYPGMLWPLLEKCSVSPDDDVTRHEYFAKKPFESEPLKLLIQLYVCRSFSCWKDSKIMVWLERNVHYLMGCMDDVKDVMEYYSQCRAKRYVMTPRNVYRHLIISDVKDFTYQLPHSMTTQSITHYDPLPPLNSTSSYEPMNRNSNRNQSQSSFLSVFLQSLSPSFNPSEVGASGSNNEDRGAEPMGAIMDGLRGILNSVFYVPPNDGNQGGDSENDWEDEPIN